MVTDALKSDAKKEVSLRRTCRCSLPYPSSSQRADATGLTSAESPGELQPPTRLTHQAMPAHTYPRLSQRWSPSKHSTSSHSTNPRIFRDLAALQRPAGLYTTGLAGCSDSTEDTQHS